MKTKLTAYESLLYELATKTALHKFEQTVSLTDAQFEPDSVFSTWTFGELVKWTMDRYYETEGRILTEEIRTQTNTRITFIDKTS